MRYSLGLFLLLSTALAQEDATLAMARGAATAYGASLPDYVCQESMQRYNVAGLNFRSLPRLADRVQAEVVYEHGNETFRNLRVNGRPAETATGGIWSIGVFGPLMASLFEVRIGAQFHRRGEGKEAGRKAIRYDFDVAEAHSNWVITVDPDKVKPAYRGSIWVEAATGRVLRHEIETVTLRPPFYYQRAALKVRYRFLTINGTEYLLPSTMESELCPRGYIYCDRVEATYNGCRKFSAESSLKFDEE
jgi:hypothetical protein